MSEKTRNLIVGVTGLVGLAGVVFLLLLFGYAPAWLERGYEVRVKLSNASGLTTDSRVRLSGIDVGRVVDVYLNEPSRRGVEVVALIRHEVLIPLNVRVRAESPLIGGSPSLSIEIDDAPDPGKQSDETFPTDDTAMIEGESLSIVSQFAGELEAAIREPTQQVSRIADDFARLTDAWSKVGDNLNRLTSVVTTQQVDDGQAMGNLTTVLARADQRFKELRAVTKGLDRWVNNEKFYTDATATVAEARKLMQRFNDGIDRLEKRYIAVADDLAGVLGSVHAMINTAASTKGTVGKLISDPALYNNLNDTVQRLEVALDEFRLLIQKWKAEGLPVQF